MSQRVRLIDKEPVVTPRPTEMKVLVLGMSRTGTMSIYTALQKLGYKPYHMLEAINNPKHFGLWEEALKAKYQGEGEPFGKKELDKILGNFDAVADIPCAIMIPEITNAYPDAKVVLTNRDVDKWLVSIKKTVGVVFSWWSWRLVAPFEPALVGPWYSFAHTAFIPLPFDTCPPSLRQTYLDHYALVRATVPASNLLEFRSEDGWEPLCKFLGKEVPRDESYPNINDSDSFVALHTQLWLLAVGRMVLKVGGTVGAVAAAFGAAWWVRNR